MVRTVLAVLLALVIPGGAIILLSAITIRGFKKLLAKETTEKLFPLRVHGSTIMLTAAEHEAVNNQD